MKMCLPARRIGRLRSSLLLAATVAVALLAPLIVHAQQHVSKKYPVPKNVRLELHNISGEITVESWDRDEIKISAVLESPTARFAPRQMSDQLIIDIMSDNRGRGDLG